MLACDSDAHLGCYLRKNQVVMGSLFGECTSTKEKKERGGGKKSETVVREPCLNM